MSNHYHVVLHVDTEQAQLWSECEVVERWHRLFNGSLLSQRYSHGEVLTPAESKTLAEVIVTWHQRLVSISWFIISCRHPQIH